MVVLCIVASSHWFKQWDLLFGFFMILGTTVRSTGCSALKHVNWFAESLQRFHAFPLTRNFPDRVWKSLMHVHTYCYHGSQKRQRLSSQVWYDMMDRLCTLCFVQPFIKSFVWPRGIAIKRIRIQLWTYPLAIHGVFSASGNPITATESPPWT